MQLSGYQIDKTLYETPSLLVWRGVRAADNTPVIIKALKEGSATHHSVERLRYEAQQLERLAAAKISGICERLDFVTVPTTALVLRDRGCQSLAVLHEEHPLAIDELLRIMQAVASTLGELHKVRCLHKDLTPGNIVYDRVSKTVQVIDFGISTFVSHELQTAGPLESIEGTAAYLSPEQTGRLNRVLDYRSDYYSLGATLFYLITNRLPFPQTNLPDLIHAILTESAPAVAEIKPEVPRCVSDLVAKLLSKNPEDRYQGSYGLQHDIKLCLEQIASKAPMAFALGTADHSERFEIPQKLYGRSKEVARLSESYQRASKGRRQTVIICGPSGIGKSALVNALQSDVGANGGVIIAGKYDQLRRHQPFSALSNAVTGLVRRLLMEDAATIERWRGILQDALGNSGAVVVRLIPALQSIVGPQRPVHDLPPQEAEYRMLALLQRFLVGLCRTQPLVVFLDDLQWIDAGTVKLLKLLADGATDAAILFIGAYRDDEVPAEHPLTSILAKWREDADNFADLSIAPLTQADIEELVSESTRATPQATRALAQSITTKTAGNPFFVHSFLNHLWSTGLLIFAPASQAWAWEIAKIESAGVTDNVVTLITQKINQLSRDETRLVSLGACLGTEFTLDALATAAQMPRDAVAAKLVPVLEAGMLQALDKEYRYAAMGGGQATVTYRFVHDRVQQAAFALLSADEAARAHYDIANRLIQERDPKTPETWIFDVIDHLKAGQALIKEPAERLQLAHYLSVAGYEAKRALAYVIAKDYFENALQVLSEANSAREQYTLVRNSKIGLTECELLLGNASNTRQLLDALLKESRTVVDRAEIHRLQAMAMTALGFFEEACVSAIAGLKLLGVRIPLKPALPTIAGQLIRVQLLLRGRDFTTIASGPAMVDEEQIRIMGLLQSMQWAAFSSNAPLFALIAMHMARRTLLFGSSRLSGFGFMVLTVALLALNNAKLAAKVFELSKDFFAKVPQSQYPGSFGGCLSSVGPLLHTPAELIELYRSYAQTSIESGDPLWATINSYHESWHLMHQSIERGAAASERYANYVKAHADPLMTTLHRSVQESIACLRGKTASPLTFSVEENTPEYGNFAGESIYKARHAWVLMLHGGLDQAHELVTNLLTAKSNFEALAPIDANFSFLIYGLVLTSHAIKSGNTKATREKWLKKFVAYLDTLARNAQVPTFAGYPLLLRAQVAAMRRQQSEAMKLFENAVPLLEAHAEPCLVALGHELAARFYLNNNLTTLAVGHCQKALRTYRQWGATTKTRLLRDEWKELDLVNVKSVEGSDAGANTTTTTTITDSFTQQSIDLPRIMKVVQTLSGEVVPEKLVVSVTENLKNLAGAQRASLLLRRSDGLHVVADTEAMDSNQMRSLDAMPADALPGRIIKLVLQSGDTVKLDDAARATEFQVDPYMVKRAPRSVLCAPIVSYGKTIGVLYLENTQLTSAFTEERLLTINLLVAQATTLLENAYRYADLERTVQARTEELQTANNRLVKMERDNAESQMAGGFAHEMRNALSGALLMAVEMDPDGDFEGTFDTVLTAVDNMREIALPKLTADEQALYNKRFKAGAKRLLQAKESIQAIRQALERGIGLTASILSYAQTGHLTVRHSDSVRVKGVLDQLLSEFKTDFAAKSIEPRFALNDTLKVGMSEEHLYAILKNLIKNACDAMEEHPDNAPRVLDVRATALQGHVEVEVQDTGIGIPEHLQPRLFEPFFSTKGAHGTGLGLALSKKLSELYGGGMSFRTVVNQGTVFHVRLPVDSSRVAGEEG